MRVVSFFSKIFFLTLFLLIISSCSDPTEITSLSPEKEDSNTPILPPILNPEENPVTWVRKKEVECDGVIYIIGLPSVSPLGKSVFCKKEYENDLQACLNDNSPETQKCHFEKAGRHLYIQ